MIKPEIHLPADMPQRYMGAYRPEGLDADAPLTAVLAPYGGRDKVFAAVTASNLSPGVFAHLFGFDKGRFRAAMGRWGRRA